MDKSEDDIIVLDQYHVLIYSLCLCSVVLFVWFLYQMITNPERFVRSLNENQRLGQDAILGGREGFPSVNYSSDDLGSMQVVDIPFTHSMQLIGGSQTNIHLEASIKQPKANPESNDDSDLSLNCGTSFTTTVAQSVPIELVNRFLSNCSSPHAINLFNTCSHFSQSEHDEACHFDLEFDPQLLLETSMFYPLVMVTMRNDESSQNEKVKGLLSVYHVKNLGNTRNSALLYQFLLCQNNASFPLKRLYMGEELCIVCQVEKSVVCLLPCGHRCVCSNCCFLIKATCPICRGQVSKTVFSRQDSNAFSV
ncbi:uncharacterized protein LOC142343275 [Convolutriloba macropyga]|uniref:uncharacterized protein LOC142343275 n=1 Tax=Convolutriloba macropyga TaxID=536237 RepID=UPI003F5234CC